MFPIKQRSEESHGTGSDITINQCTNEQPTVTYILQGGNNNDYVVV